MSENKTMAHDPLANLHEMGHSTEALKGHESTEEQPMTEEATTFDLGSSLTIADVSEMHEKFRGLLDAGGDICLSIANLEQIDGAGLQLLVLMIKESTERQNDFTWSGESTVLKQMAEYGGLSGILKLD